MYLNEDEPKKADKSQKKGKKSKDEASQKFLNTRQVLVSGEINEELAHTVIGKVLLLEALSPTKPIYIYIDSPGGNVYSGFAILDVLRFVKPPVKTIGTGLVASAASLVLLGAKKQNRFALPNSQYLIHQPLSEMRGVATDLEIHAKEIERIRSRINTIIAEETGKTQDDVAIDTERDYWLNAREALEYGLVSKVIKTRKDLPTK